jgi:hypothetical protein
MHVMHVTVLIELRLLIPSCATLCPADWANPVSYIQQAIAINEFKSPRWQNVPAPGYANAGEAILIQRGVHTDEWWIWLVSERAWLSLCCAEEQIRMIGIMHTAPFGASPPFSRIPAAVGCWCGCGRLGGVQCRLLAGACIP